MATTTPMQGWPVPTSGDDPDIPADLLALASAIEKRVVGVYSGIVDRAAKVTAPTAGMIAFLQDTQDYTWYNGTSWAQLWPVALPEFTGGTALPDNGSGADGDVFFRY